jgi:acetamidase/formamidase
LCQQSIFLILAGNNDSADDMKNVDLTRIHYLSGPFEIETAEPGDVLLVEIMDVQPMEKQPVSSLDSSSHSSFADNSTVGIVSSSTSYAQIIY